VTRACGIGPSRRILSLRARTIRGNRLHNPDTLRGHLALKKLDTPTLAGVLPAPRQRALTRRIELTGTTF